MFKHCASSYRKTEKTIFIQWTDNTSLFDHFKKECIEKEIKYRINHKIGRFWIDKNKMVLLDWKE